MKRVNTFLSLMGVCACALLACNDVGDTTESQAAGGGEGDSLRSAEGALLNAVEWDTAALFSLQVDPIAGRARSSSIPFGDVNRTGRLRQRRRL